MFASQNGHIEVVNKLIEMKAYIEAADRYVSEYHNESDNND